MLVFRTMVFGTDQGSDRRRHELLVNPTLVPRGSIAKRSSSAAFSSILGALALCPSYGHHHRGALQKKIEQAQAIV
jgi:hypothetical protein